MRRAFFIFLTAVASLVASAQSAFYNAMNSAAWSGGKYKGFIEAGALKGVGSHNMDMIDILTTHGALIGDSFFVGAGLGATILLTDNELDTRSERYNDVTTKAVMIPLYADMRYTFGSYDATIRPFVDLKLGASLLVSNDYVAVGDRYIDNDRAMAYISPTFGVRFSTSAGIGINLGVTYNLISQRLYYYDDYDYYYHYYNYDGAILHAIGARLQIEW